MKKSDFDSQTRKSEFKNFLRVGMLVSICVIFVVGLLHVMAYDLCMELTFQLNIGLLISSLVIFCVCGLMFFGILLFESYSGDSL